MIPLFIIFSGPFLPLMPYSLLQLLGPNLSFLTKLAYYPLSSKGTWGVVLIIGAYYKQVVWLLD